MATTTLTLGDVAVDGTLGPHTGSGVTGSPPQWADGSDATYATIQRVTADGWTGTDHANAVGTAVSGEVTSIVANLRVAASATGTVNVSGSLIQEPYTFGFADFSAAVPGDDVIRDLTADLTLWENPRDWLAGGVLVDVAISSPLGTLLRIYGLSFTVTTTDVAPTEEPVTRLWPRDDALGLSSAPRLVPPPKARRVVGGYL